MKLMRLTVATGALLLAALAIAACGGGGSSSSSAPSPEPASSQSPAEGESEAGSTIVAAPSEIPPTTIPKGLEPLPKPPPTGISVVTLQCDIPTCKGFTEVFEEAAKSLGWHNRTIVFKTGQPQDAMTQAVNTPGVEYINISGVTTSIIKPQLKVAAEKGITVMKGEDPGPAEPPTVPLAISNAYGNAERPAEEITRWMINDSGGKAHIAVIALPEIPITATIPPAVEKLVEKECPECSVDEIAVTGEELAAGTVPAKVVAFLQSHPEVNYVDGAFGNLTLGVGPALKTAGYAEKVKLVTGSGIEAAEAEALKKGEIAAYYVSAQGEFSTAWADAIARDAEGLPLPAKVYEEMPQGWLCKPETAEQCREWETFPTDFLEKYEELWGLK
jgi:ribose transport system substrate-binding protein